MTLLFCVIIGYMRYLYINLRELYICGELWGEMGDCVDDLRNEKRVCRLNF